MPPKKRTFIANEGKKAAKEESTKRRSRKSLATKASSPPPKEVKPAETAPPASTSNSDGVKEVFWRYVNYNRYSDDEHQAKSKQKAEGHFREKVERIQRIEKAIENGVNEILTFEFFNFASPLSSVGDDVVAEIFLISFNDQQPPECFPLFDGPLPLRWEKDQRVLYFPVPQSFTKESVVFLVAKVDVTANASHCRRARAADEASMERFWGTKKVSRSGKKSFDAIYGNSSINLLCPTKFQTASVNQKLLEDDWFLDKSAVAGLEGKTKVKLASTSLSRVDYELSDQHCDEDWDDIRQGMRNWAERIALKEEGASTSFIFENKNGADRSVLLELPSLRCPFSGADFESQEKLLNHLKAAYPRLDFVQEDDSTIVVSLPALSERKDVDEGSSAPHVWAPGPLPYKALAFNPPREQKISLSANYSNALRHVPHGTWKRDIMWRAVVDDMALDPTTKEFMLLVNDHMQVDNSEALGQAAIRKAFMTFVTENAQMLSDKNMHLMALTMAIKLQNQHILTADDYTDLFEVISLTD